MSEGFEVEGASEPRSLERLRVASGRRGKPFADLLAEREERSPDLAEKLGFSSAAMHAGALVRAWRKACGYTQRDLADRIGVTQERISNIERGVGKHGPTFDVMTQIADACGYPLAQTAGKSQEGEDNLSRGDEIDPGLERMAAVSESTTGSIPYRTPSPVYRQDVVFELIVTACAGVGLGLLAGFLGKGEALSRAHRRESELVKKLNAATEELRRLRGEQLGESLRVRDEPLGEVRSRSAREAAELRREEAENKETEQHVLEVG